MNWGLPLTEDRDRIPPMGGPEIVTQYPARPQPSPSQSTSQSTSLQAISNPPPTTQTFGGSPSPPRKIGGPSSMELTQLPTDGGSPAPSQTHEWPSTMLVDLVPKPTHSMWNDYDAAHDAQFHATQVVWEPPQSTAGPWSPSTVDWAPRPASTTSQPLDAGNYVTVAGQLANGSPTSALPFRPSDLPVTRPSQWEQLGTEQGRADDAGGSYVSQAFLPPPGAPGPGRSADTAYASLPVAEPTPAIPHWPAHSNMAEDEDNLGPTTKSSHGTSRATHPRPSTTSQISDRKPSDMPKSGAKVQPTAKSGHGVPRVSNPPIATPDVSKAAASASLSHASRSGSRNVKGPAPTSKSNPAFPYSPRGPTLTYTMIVGPEGNRPPSGAVLSKDHQRRDNVRDRQQSHTARSPNDASKRGGPGLRKRTGHNDPCDRLQIGDPCVNRKGWQGMCEGVERSRHHWRAWCNVRYLYPQRPPPSSELTDTNGEDADGNRLGLGQTEAGAEDLQAGDHFSDDQDA